MTCWSMWKLKSSFSPIAAIGEAKASSSRAEARRESARASGASASRGGAACARASRRRRREQRPAPAAADRTSSLVSTPPTRLRRREALPLPPRHLAGPRGGGALPRQARVRPRRAARPDRRGVPVLRAGMSWEELDRMGFKLRLSELERGAVNVVVQPGQWELPRVDHLGLALDEDEFARRRRPRRRAGAPRPGARRPPDVHRHERRLPARGAPAARVARRAARGERGAPADASCSCSPTIPRRRRRCWPGCSTSSGTARA